MGNDLLSFKKWIFRDGQQVRGNAHRDKRWTLMALQMNVSIATCKKAGVDKVKKIPL